MDPFAISDRTTVGLYFRSAERYAEEPALHHYEDEEWRTVTWGDAREQVVRIACALIGAGVQPHQHVILLSENRREWIYCDFAIQAVGAVTVPVYPNSTAPVAQRIADDCEAVLAIASDEKKAAKLAPTGSLKAVARMDRELPSWVAATPSPELVNELARRLQAVDPEDVATIIYTSGTTGEPKGVVLLHRNLVDTARAALEVFPLDQTDIYLSFLPMAHSFERVAGIMVGVGAGIQAYLSRGIDVLGQDISEVRPTLMNSVPRMYEKMHALVHDRVRASPAWRRRIFEWGMGVGRRRLHEPAPGPWLRLQHGLAERLVFRPARLALTGGRLRFFVSGGAWLSAEVEEFFWAIGVKIYNGWGLTETSAATCSNREDCHRYGTVGRPLPGVEIRIAEDGEILVRGPGVMQGYHRNPEATAEVMDGPWFKSGDIGELDPDGFLKITDRKKDLFKTAGGKYIAPQQLEFAIQQHPEVERAVVVGDGRPYVTALVIPNWPAVRKTLGKQGEPEELVEDEQVRAHFQAIIDEVNTGLGSWETVKYFTLLAHDLSEERGELTPTLKVKRRVIHERYEDQIGSMYSGRAKAG
jgi:long-chain acyl-CoA synthetase